MPNHGFEVRGVHPSCVHGWAPHAREADWETGTLFEWPRLEGGDDAFLLRVGLSDRDAVWMELRMRSNEAQDQLSAIVNEIDGFEDRCRESEYTDTGEAWGLLTRIREALSLRMGLPAGDAGRTEPGGGPEGREGGST